MILKTFKLGGVHPPENKISAGAAIQHLPLPDKLFVPLPNILERLQRQSSIVEMMSNRTTDC